MPDVNTLEVLEGYETGETIPFQFVGQNVRVSYRSGLVKKAMRGREAVVIWLSTEARQITFSMKLIRGTGGDPDPMPAEKIAEYLGLLERLTESDPLLERAARCVWSYGQYVFAPACYVESAELTGSVISDHDNQFDEATFQVTLVKAEFPDSGRGSADPV